MKYKGYILSFTTAIHAGKGKLDDIGIDIYADTLFSALCHEALSQGGTELLQKLVTLTKDSKLRLSDAFPVFENGDRKEFYIPKPFIKVEHEQSGESSRIKKSIKKMKYIPFSGLAAFTAGKFDPVEESERLDHMGKGEIRTMSRVMEGEDAKPYNVGTFTFAPGWSLYTIIGYESDEDALLAENLLDSIGYTGLGGKRSSGLGKFTLRNAKLPEGFLKLLTVEKKKGRFMSMSVGLSDDDKLGTITLDSQYVLIQRRGFVSSETYAQTYRKKKDFYCFKAGSTFNETFEGRIEDVSEGGSHPVYRYANPIFMEVL